MLGFWTTEEGGVFVITLEPEDGARRGERPGSSRESLYLGIEAHASSRFAIDCGALAFTASTDVGFLVTLKQRIEARGGSLVLFRVDPYVRDIFDRMGLRRFFPIVEGRSEALAFRSDLA